MEGGDVKKIEEENKEEVVQQKIEEGKQLTSEESMILVEVNNTILE